MTLVWYKKATLIDCSENLCVCLVTDPYSSKHSKVLRYPHNIESEMLKYKELQSLYSYRVDIPHLNPCESQMARQNSRPDEDYKGQRFLGCLVIMQWLFNPDCLEISLSRMRKC